MSKTNVGDQVCCPADYFPLGEVARVDLVECDARADAAVLREADYIVLGGGGVFYFREVTEALCAAHGKKTIVWGAGANRHDSETQDYPPSLRECALVGLRDDCAEWVPCVSCLSPLFDVQTRAEYPVAVYEHKNFPILTQQYEWPRLKNNASFEGAVRFLSQARVIVTNSFHGAYWARLLGRQVVLYEPFSSKFFRMKWQPPIATDMDQLTRLIASVAGATPTAYLDEARQATARFYERVTAFLHC